MIRTSTTDDEVRIYSNNKYIGVFAGVMFLRGPDIVRCWNSCLKFNKTATKPMIVTTLKFAYFDYIK